MRNILFITIIISLISCDDGDFEVPSFEFDTAVSHCGSHVLYRTNSEQSEALILHLNPTDIVQEVGNKQIAITKENVIYRIFDTSLSTDYFCADVPPVEPVVIREWIAVTGSNNFIDIETTLITDEEGISTGYKHVLVLHNLILESNSEKISYETYLFGSFNTPI